MDRERRATKGWELFMDYVNRLWRQDNTRLVVLQKQGQAYTLAGMEGQHLCPHPYTDEFGYGCDCCMGICSHVQSLRVGKFDNCGKIMVVEEYIAIEDERLDENVIHIAVYEDGHRPYLRTTVLSRQATPPKLVPA